MAKKRKRKYSRGAGTEVKREMHRYKRGKAKSGKGGKGGKVKSRKQAIAIGLSKARRRARKCPRKNSGGLPSNAGGNAQVSQPSAPSTARWSGSRHCALRITRL